MTEMHESSSQDSGSFGTGFTLGVVAGVVGFYLFGTKKGSQTRERLAKEWEVAKEMVIQEIESGEAISLKDLAQQAKRGMLSVLDGMQSKQSKKPVKAQKSSSEPDATSKPRKKKKMFKGV